HAMDDRLDKLGETIAGALADSLTGHLVANGELTISAISHDIVKVVRFLRDDERCQFWSLIDITAVDWPGRERRFDVVYHLLSPWEGPAYSLPGDEKAGDGKPDK